MKKLISKTTVLMILLFTMQKSSLCQQIKINEPDQSMPTVFDNVPDTVSANIGLLTILFNQEQGQRMRVQLSDRFSIEGTLASVAQKSNGAIQTFRFTSENFPGTSLVFTRTTGPSGEPVYRGLILGKNVKDCFMLVKESNHYYFVKKNIHTLRAE